MRKSNIYTILFCLVICVFLACILISTEVFGIELERDYTDDFGPFIGELYFDSMVDHSSIFCNGYGMPFFVKKKTRIDITGWVNFQDKNVVNTTIEGYSDELGQYDTASPIVIVGPVEHGKCGGTQSYELKLTATSYSGSAKSASIITSCQPRTASVSYDPNATESNSTVQKKTLPIAVYATGITNYTSLPARKEINNNIAYILAEANANTPGLKPNESEANIAWWNKDSNFITISGDPGEFEYFAPEDDPRAENIDATAVEVIADIGKQVTEIDNLIQELNQELTFLESDNQTAQARIAELNNQITELEAYIANQEYEKSLFEGYRDSDRQKLEQLKVELESLKANSKNDQSELKKLNKERQIIQAQISRLSSDISKSQETVDTLYDEIVNLKNEIDVLEIELTELRNNGGTTNEIAIKNTEISEKQNEYDSKRSEITAKEIIIQQKQAQVVQKQSELNNKQVQINIEQTVVDSRQSDIDNKQREIDSTDATLKNDMQIIDQCERNIADAQLKIENAKSKIESYKYVTGENDGTWKEGTTPNKATMTYEEYKSYLQNRITELESQKQQLEQEITLIENSKDSDKSRLDEIKKIYDKYQENKSTNKEGYSAHSANGKLHEAEIFNQMHDVIRDVGGDIGPGATVDYQKTVKDLTNTANVKVDYNSETQEYTVGPFSIQYLEVYAFNNQFAGITGDPVLSVIRDNGEEIKMRLSDGNWGFAYKKRNDNGSLEDVERKQVGTLGDRVPQVDETTVFTDFDAVPHTDEEFYIVVNYGEGIHKLTGLEFEFRCLTIEAEREESTGTVEKYKWEIDAISFGSCPEETTTTTTTTTTNDDGEEVETTEESTSTCGQPNSATITVKRSYVGDIAIQPTMRVVMAKRGYGELTMYDENNIVAVPDSNSASLKVVWDIDLTTVIAGDVWVDEDDQNVSNAIDGIRQPEIEKERGIKNIAVTVYLYAGTSKVKQAIAHDASGARINWPIYTNDAGHWEVDRLEAPGGGAKYFYVVEFEYDGQFLKSTTYMANNGGGQGTASQFKENPDSFRNSSLAVEEIDSRYRFDQSFGEITGDSQINGTDTEGFTNATDEAGEDANYNPENVDPSSPAASWNGEFTGRELSNRVSYKGEYEAEDGTNETRIKSTLKSPYTDEENPAKVTWVDEGATKEEYKRYRMVATTFYNDTSSHGLNVNRDDFRTNFPVDEWTYTMNKNVDGDKRYLADYMLHINLGLKEREETDISVLKDLYKVTVVVNERKITKEFNIHGDKSQYKDFLVGLNDTKKNGGYTLGLYSSDVAYQSYQRYCNAIDKVQEIKEGTELRVFATYVIRAYNNSETNDVEINELIDYYDSEFTLVEEDFSTSIVNDDMKRENIRVAESPYYRICDTTIASEWKPTREDNLANYGNGDGVISGELLWEKVDGMNALRTTELAEKKLKNTQYAEIFTTYEINQDGYYNMRDNNSASMSERNNLLGDHYNVAEVSSYSTYYSTEDMKPEGDYKNYQAGWISGKVDKDSAPNNINRSELTNEYNYEDDTYQASILKIELRATERDMWGVVWEDKKVNDEDHGIKVSDGIYNNEDAVENVEVTLFEVINLSEVNSSGDYSGEFDGYEYYYKVPNQFYNFPVGSQNGNDGTGPVMTGGSAGDEGNWYIYGFLAGDYVVRFDYGKNSDEDSTIYKNDGSSSTEEIIRHNGQDYENSKFMGNYLEDGTLNDKFLDLTGQAIPSDSQVSKARDNESRRMVVNSYSRTIENDRAEVLRDRLISNDEYVESTQMFSETPIMQVEIEDPKIIKRNNTPNGTPANPLYVEGRDNVVNSSYRYSIPNINFGLEERAKTDIKLETFIDTISLVKTGEVLCQVVVNEDGTVDTQNEKSQYLDKLTYIGHQPYDGTASGVCQQGFFAIAVENEFMNDLSLMITYKIKVSNVSEVDFTGALNRYYDSADIVAAASRTDTINLYDINGGSLAELYEDGISTNTTLHDLIEIQNDGTESVEDKISELISNGDTYTIDPEDSLRPEVIVYGKYVGRFYYENRIGEDGDVYEVANHQLKTTENPIRDNITITYPADNIVKTTVDQIIEYVDINTSMDLEENTSVENGSWTLVDPNVESTGTVEALKNVLSDSSYKEHGRTLEEGRGLYDDKGRRFFRGSNVNMAISDNEILTRDENNRVKYNPDNISSGLKSTYNPDLTTELTPKDYLDVEDEYSSVIYFTTRKNTTSDAEANEMKMDNLAEVLVYSNTIGRRDVNSVPGNAISIAKDNGFWLAGYGSIDYYGMRNIDDYTNVNGTNSIYNWSAYPENDQFAPEYVSIIPPTGIARMTIVRNNVVQLVGMGAVLIGLVVMFIVKQKKIFKNIDNTNKNK